MTEHGQKRLFFATGVTGCLTIMLGNLMHTTQAEWTPDVGRSKRPLFELLCIRITLCFLFGFPLSCLGYCVCLCGCGCRWGGHIMYWITCGKRGGFYTEGWLALFCYLLRLWFDRPTILWPDSKVFFHATGYWLSFRMPLYTYVVTHHDSSKQ